MQYIYIDNLTSTESLISSRYLNSSQPSFEMFDIDGDSMVEVIGYNMPILQTHYSDKVYKFNSNKTLDYLWTLNHNAQINNFLPITYLLDSN